MYIHLFMSRYQDIWWIVDGFSDEYTEYYKKEVERIPDGDSAPLMNLFLFF